MGGITGHEPASPASATGRAVAGAVTIQTGRGFAEKMLPAVERDTDNSLGGMLESSGVEWVE